MTTPNKNECPETITISVPGPAQTVIDILHSQYSNLESGEVRAKLETFHTDVWNKEEFEQLFDVLNIDGPLIYAMRKCDSVCGSVMFIDSPRFYFSFQAGTPHDGQCQT